MISYAKHLTLDELNALVDKANEKGGNLDLNSLTSIPEGFNPTVGGSLYLSSLSSEESARPKDEEFINP